MRNVIVWVGGVPPSQAEPPRILLRRRLLHSLSSPDDWVLHGPRRGLYLPNKAGVIWEIGSEGDYNTPRPRARPNPSFPPTSWHSYHPWEIRKESRKVASGCAPLAQEVREKVDARSSGRCTPKAPGRPQVPREARRRPGARVRAGGVGGQRQRGCAREPPPLTCPGGRGGARR